MKSINPYLNFAGDTEEAFKFYKSVFGGDFSMIQRFGETPEASRVADGEKNKIMHVSLPVGKGDVLMATDALESMGHKLTVGNNFSLAVEAESKDEADTLFKGLSVGGKVSVPMSNQFWGAYFGAVTDRFGVQWMVSHTPPRQNG